MFTGTVIKSTGSWYQVRLDAAADLPPGQDPVVLCRIVGKFRLDNMPLTNPVAVGDRVEVEMEQEGKGLIKKIMPRRNYVMRQSPRRKHDLHLLAANIDQAVLIVTVVQPDLKPGFIDRFLVMIEHDDIPVTLVFNKADLYDEFAMETFRQMQAVYESIGYGVLLSSVSTGLGLQEFKALLAHKTTLVSGQSGVGKSSLVNAVQPKLDLRTGDISDYSGKGQHTTTFAEMFELDYGGRIIDTPGMKMLAFNNKDKANIAHSFREFFRLSKQCKFGGACLHRNEPSCAVRQALIEGQISPLRYENYLALLSEVEDQNYWERQRAL